MASSPSKKRRRRLPKNITEKTDREVLTRVFGKRAMKHLDQKLQEYDGKDVTTSHE